jgi:hypothetical protein
MGEKDIKDELKAQFSQIEMFQVIFGMILIAASVILMVIFGASAAYIYVLLTGISLVIYTIRSFLIQTNLMDQLNKGAKDVHLEVKARLNETFIIQIIFGIAMVVVPVIMMLTIYGFNLNLLMSIISGGLLLFYAIRYLYVGAQNLVDKIEKHSKSSP